MCVVYVVCVVCIVWYLVRVYGMSVVYMWFVVCGVYVRVWYIVCGMGGVCVVCSVYVV